MGYPGEVGELLQLGVCQPGEAGIFCAKCPPGTYNPPKATEDSATNVTAQFRTCKPCANKPLHGNYTRFGWLNASCPYACPAGFPPVEVNPNCDDPWIYYFAFFGGVRGVVLVMLGTVVSFALLLSATQVRRRRRLMWLRKQRHTGRQFSGLDDEVQLLFELVRGSHPLSAMGGRQAGRGLGLRRLFQRSMPEPRQAHLLSMRDLPYHAVRIYLLGENSPRDPWRLDRSPPEELSHLIDPLRWESFAAQVTQQCKEKMRVQYVVEDVVRWLYLPLAEYIRWQLRLSRALKLAAFVWAWSEDSRPDQIFWRLSTDNSSRLGLKFGSDRQMTLAFIDVLDYGKSLEDWAVKPQLPMVIAAAGDGEYTAPYHLDYTDPFVQSVAEYVGRHLWHQVLLAFNLIARLLPPNPTETDLRPLRQCMSKVSARILQQTDLECHAILFEAPVPKLCYKTSKRRRASRAMSRVASWETMAGNAAPPPLRLTISQSVATGGGSAALSPTGGTTPTLLQSHTPTPGTCIMRRRLALVLTQRPMNDLLQVPARSLTRMDAVPPNVMSLHKSLVSPAGCLEQYQESPNLSYLQAPYQDEALGGFRLDSNQTSFRTQRQGHARQYSGSGSGSPPGTPRPKALGSSTEGRLPFLRRMRSYSSRGCNMILQRLEAALHSVVSPGNAIMAWYMRKLRGLRPLGGVGRQPGIYLRHRKPRGAQAPTLLLLLVALVVATYGFIAQSAALFRLSPGHSAFFVSLLWPPFADVLALVNAVLFMCGAAEGTSVCLFVVASNVNTGIGLLLRVCAMDRLRSSGLLYVLAEYLIMFLDKAAICRLVNLMIAQAEAEPTLLEPAGETDNEWVRDHVIFRRGNSPHMESKEGTRDHADMMAFQTEEQEAAAWTGSEAESSRALASLPVVRRKPQREMHRQESVGSDGWTPLLHDDARSRH